MAEFELNYPEDTEELSSVIEFIKGNPDSKRYNVECPDHGEHILIILDDVPSKSIIFMGCCNVAIDKRRKLIKSIMACPVSRS
jgi:hypothetical protein